MPSFASSRKHIRHSPKSLINPCFRPHLKQRFVTLDENFGVFLLRAITDVFAIVVFVSFYNNHCLNITFISVNLRHFTKTYGNTRITDSPRILTQNQTLDNRYQTGNNTKSDHFVIALCIYKLWKQYYQLNGAGFTVATAFDVPTIFPVVSNTLISNLTSCLKYVLFVIITGTS